MKEILRLALMAGIIVTVVYIDAHARTRRAPPPPFTGGNIGAWLGRGPIFGFEDGGGANGGWGGGYFELEPWSGWGGGSGGSGGGYGGAGGGGFGGKGNEWDHGHRGGLQGNCWAEYLPGRRSECACSITYNVGNPPPSGTPLTGYCELATEDWYSSCGDVDDVCTGYMP